MNRRSYRQNCALARAADHIGERWTLLLLRDLLVSPRRFKELSASLKGIGTNLLTSRLKGLQASGIIERRQAGGAAWVYALTESGRDLEPAILALIRWALAHTLDGDLDNHHRDDWDLLALKALFQPSQAINLSVCTQFRSASFEGWARIRNQQMSVGVGTAESVDIGVNGTVTDLFLESANLRKLMTKGDLPMLQRFMSVFSLSTPSFSMQ